MNEQDFLIITVDKQLFGIETKYIYQLIGLVDISEIETELNYLKGMINFHGEHIPVIDLSLKIEIQKPVKIDINSTMAIVDYNNKKNGFIFSEVIGIEKIKNENIVMKNKELYKFKDYIYGIVDVKNLAKIDKKKYDGANCFLLSIDKIIS